MEKHKKIEHAFDTKSFAKINLGLKILNKRIDNFHNIQSIFIQISLADELSFIPKTGFKLITKGIKIPNNRYNTIWKAVDLIEKKYNIKINHHIVVNKKIPIGAGLGGGSSNATTTLSILNKLYQLNITNNNLKFLANMISSDSPFFVDGKIQFVEGKGDVMSKQTNIPFKSKIILLVFPSFKINTQWAYKNIKKYLDTFIKRPKFPTLTNDIDWSLFENDFEKVVSSAYPEILEIKNALYRYGAHYSGLSGSGSTMFGIYNDINSLFKAQEALKSYQTYIATPVIE